MKNVAELPLIVALSGDPGGANALAPVIDALRGSGQVQVGARAYRQAVGVWQKRGMSFDTVDETVEPEIPEGTQLVLTSTSLNGVDLEKRLIVEARSRGIPSITLLDFWSNYRRRFSSDGATLDCLPEKIAVMDAQAQTEMIAEGFDAERLVVTGQPAFDRLAHWRSGFTPEDRTAVRARLGVGPGELLVVFASQPFFMFRGSGVDLPEYPGYDERSVAALLVKALERIAGESHRGVTLVIRLHPREEAASFQHLHSARSAHPGCCGGRRLRDGLRGGSRDRHEHSFARRSLLPRLRGCQFATKPARCRYAPDEPTGLQPCALFRGGNPIDDSRIAPRRERRQALQEKLTH